MEPIIKYQYTYFIKDFVMNKSTYNKYIKRLLKNNKFKLKMWNKEKDIGIDTYFEDNIKEIMFSTLNYTKKQTNKEKSQCLFFEYKIDPKMQAKLGEENGIFFKIEKIELICFENGICFLIIKTYLDEGKKINNIVDFNSKFNKLENSKINIQSDDFKDKQNLINLLKDITENKMDYKQFYTYSYICVDGENWNDKIDFSNIETEVKKVVNDENINFIEKSDYIKVGISNKSTLLVTNSLDSYNYTKLPFEFENQYLYTLIYALYEKKMLEHINKKSSKKVINNFVNKIWSKKLTEDDLGSKLYSEWKSKFKLEDLYLKIMSEYEEKCKKQRKNSKRITIVIWIILAICLVVNVVNIITLINLE